MPLIAIVQSRLTRLGATLPTDWDEPAQLEGHDLPEPLRQLACVKWPKEVTYKNEDIDQPWVWGLEVGGLAWLDTNEIGVEHDGPLAILGIADGGNVFIVVRMDDPDPTDPVVYQVDHDDPEQTLFGDVRLSTFLASLRPEGDGESTLAPITDVDPQFMSLLHPEVVWDRLDEAAQRVRPRDVAPLVAYYQSLGSDWARKMAVVAMVHGSKDVALQEVMLDILQAPALTGDDDVDYNILHTKVDALVHLTGDRELYKDRAAALRRIEPYLAERGLA